MKKFLSFFLIIFFVFFAFSLLNAQGLTNDNSGGQRAVSSQPCPADAPAGSICLSNPLGVDSPQLLIGRVINAILGIVGSIALVMFIYGGLTWMISGGSAEKVKKGRDIIVWSAVGLIVIFISYGLVRFLILNIK